MNLKLIKGMRIVAATHNPGKVPEIAALHTTNGRWDLVAEISCDGLGSFDALLGTIRSIDGIRDSETSLLLSSATI